MKKKLDELKKMQLIYSAELFVFVIVAAVLGILFLTEIIAIKPWKKWVFTCVTLLGGIWIIADFVWTLISPKKRAKNCLLDKILPLPSALGLIVCNSYSLVNLIQDKEWMGPNGINIFKYTIGIALCYIAIIYLVEGIYHLYVPHPSILEAYNEELKEKEKEEQLLKEKLKQEEAKKEIEEIKSKVEETK